MNITCIFPLKKLDEPHLSAMKEYEKRLQRYCKCKFLPVCRSKKITENTAVIYITSGNPNAAVLSSEDFADQLKDHALHGRSDLLFVLSGTPEDPKNAISLSYANLPIPTLTVLLSEQIYRAFRIIHNHSYHK